jgi:hypothetical protein
MKEYRESRGTAPFILNLGSRSANFTNRPLHSRLRKPVLFEQEVR